MSIGPASTNFGVPIYGRFKGVLDPRTVGVESPADTPHADDTAKGMLRVVFDNQASNNYKLYVNKDGTTEGWEQIGLLSNAQASALAGISSSNTIQEQLDALSTNKQNTITASNPLNANLIGDPSWVGEVVNGEFRKLNGIGTQYIRAALDERLVYPSISGNDGKVLGLVSGAFEWVAQSGGGSTNVLSTIQDDETDPVERNAIFDALANKAAKRAFVHLKSVEYKDGNDDWINVNYNVTGNRYGGVPVAPPSDWHHVQCWSQDGSGLQVHESDTSVIEFNHSEQCIEIKVAGFYRVHANIHMHETVAGTSTRAVIGFRVASYRKATVEDDADWMFPPHAPISCCTYIRDASGANEGSAHMTMILSCPLTGGVNDKLKVCSARFAAAGNLAIHAGFSNFGVEGPL